MISEMNVNSVVISSNVVYLDRPLRLLMKCTLFINLLISYCYNHDCPTLYRSVFLLLHLLK